MENNLDVLLTALYVDLEDRVLPALGWSREHLAGRKPALADAELICLAVAQQLLGVPSERRWIRYAQARLSSMFPQLPGRPSTSRRCSPHILGPKRHPERGTMRERDEGEEPRWKSQAPPPRGWRH